MASRQLNMAALNAEILSRKRHLANIKEEAEDPNHQPKVIKISKLHLKTDKNKKNNHSDITAGNLNAPNDEPEKVDFLEGEDSQGNKKTYADVHEQLRRKEEIYNQLKENPNVAISNKLRLGFKFY